jgi:hypothetical protein
LGSSLFIIHFSDDPFDFHQIVIGADRVCLITPLRAASPNPVAWEEVCPARYEIANRFKMGSS